MTRPVYVRAINTHKAAEIQMLRSRSKSLSFGHAQLKNKIRVGRIRPLARISRYASIRIAPSMPTLEKVSNKMPAPPARSIFSNVRGPNLNRWTENRYTVAESQNGR
jgi:hypothetical protein